MSKTGTYVLEPGKGLVKVSDDVPRIYGADVFMPKGDVPYYDKSYRMKFESRAHKRATLKADGMKEGGIITSTERRVFEGPTKNRTKPTLEQKQRRAESKAWVQSQGGAAGLLQRLHGGA